MHDAQILDDHLRVIARKAGSYDPISGGGWAINMSNWEQVGDDAVQTTVRDLAKWDAISTLLKSADARSSTRCSTSAR
jgi:hypothetical protein